MAHRPQSMPILPETFQSKQNLQKHVSNSATVCAQTLLRIQTIDNHTEDNHENVGEPCSLCKGGFLIHKPSNIDMAASCCEKDIQHGTTDEWSPPDEDETKDVD